MRLLWLLLAAQTLAAQPAAQVHELSSPRQSAPTRVRVLVPENHPGPYRVLYLLPVEPGPGERWGVGFDQAVNLNLHNRFGLLCVAPEFAELPWYADHPDRADLAQESYFLQDVLPLIETSYPVQTGPQGRLLLGFSKSGWGAWSLLLRHPTLFAKAAAWDAPLKKHEPNQFLMGPVFETQENFEKYEIARLLERRKPDLQGEPRLILTGYGNFREHHEAIRELMESLQIPHVYRDGPHREHHWASGWVEEAVELLAGE